MLFCFCYVLHFFYYRLTRVVPDKIQRAVKCFVCGCFVYFFAWKSFFIFMTSKRSNAFHFLYIFEQTVPILTSSHLLDPIQPQFFLSDSSHMVTPPNHLKTILRLQRTLRNLNPAFCFSIMQTGKPYWVKVLSHSKHYHSGEVFPCMACQYLGYWKNVT